jgi:hypothetical protein
MRKSRSIRLTLINAILPAVCCSWHEEQDIEW